MILCGLGATFGIYIAQSRCTRYNIMW